MTQVNLQNKPKASISFSATPFGALDLQSVRQADPFLFGVRRTSTLLGMMGEAHKLTTEI